MAFLREAVRRAGAGGVEEGTGYHIIAPSILYRWLTGGGEGAVDADGTTIRVQEEALADKGWMFRNLASDSVPQGGDPVLAPFLKAGDDRSFILWSADGF